MITDDSKMLINENILFIMEHLRKEIEKTSSIKQKSIYCECIKTLAEAYQIINNTTEENNNETVQS